ncbi:MAG TPA: hypothetical protein VM100_12475 [Longimicrobiales bacterium]|nr:hypothetical protein [Longimicrobiales bacterium]
MDTTYRSLASANAGEILAIRRILSKSLRGFCEALGVREGDAVYCRSNTSSRLILKTARGRVVSLDQDWARFIQIEPNADTPLAG